MACVQSLSAEWGAALPPDVQQRILAAQQRYQLNHTEGKSQPTTPGKVTPGIASPLYTPAASPSAIPEQTLDAFAGGHEDAFNQLGMDSEEDDSDDDPSGNFTGSQPVSPLNSSGGMRGGCNGYALSSGKGSKQKKRLGRPASFNEDEIDWDKLSPEDRRKIRRRLSNRASAHRVRQRRLEMMNGLQGKIQQLHQQHAIMIARLTHSETAQKHLMHELQLSKERWSATAQENIELHHDNNMLRQKLAELTGSKGGLATLDSSTMNNNTNNNGHSATDAKPLPKAEPGVDDPVQPAAANADESPSAVTLHTSFAPSTTGNNAPIPLPSGFSAGNLLNTPLSAPVASAGADLTISPLSLGDGPQAATSQPQGYSSAIVNTVGSGALFPMQSQLTLGLDRNFTLSFGFGDMDAAPSLGIQLPSLMDLGVGTATSGAMS